MGDRRGGMVSGGSIGEEEWGRDGDRGEGEEG